MIDDQDLLIGELRLLTVDNGQILPILTNIRFLITSNDVIHSYAIPSQGIKCDAIPGRINILSLFISRYSSYYGQCSELCGVLHGFMPIILYSVDILAFISLLAPSIIPLLL